MQVDAAASIPDCSSSGRRQGGSAGVLIVQSSSSLARVFASAIRWISPVRAAVESLPRRRTATGGPQAPRGPPGAAEPEDGAGVTAAHRDQRAGSECSTGSLRRATARAGVWVVASTTPTGRRTRAGADDVTPLGHTVASHAYPIAGGPGGPRTVTRCGTRSRTSTVASASSRRPRVRCSLPFQTKFSGRGMRCAAAQASPAIPLLAMEGYVLRDEGRFDEAAIAIAG